MTGYCSTPQWVQGPPIPVQCEVCGRTYDRRCRKVNPWTRWVSCPCGCGTIREQVVEEPIVADEYLVR